MARRDSALPAMCGATKSERRLLARLPDEPRALLYQQIELLALRERRALRALSALEKATRGAPEALEEHAQKEARVCGKAAVDSEQTSLEHTTRRSSAFSARQELDAQLGRLNEQKLKAIELLARLDERQGDQSGGVRLSICIPDNGRARVEPEPERAALADASTTALPECDMAARAADAEPG